MFGAARIAIDGSKFKAPNGAERHFTEARLKRRLEQIDAQIVRYPKALDEHDRDDGARTPPTGAAMPALLKPLRGRRARYQGVLGQLADSDEQQLSPTDADARYPGPAGIVGDNGQPAVDDQHPLICVFAVTHGPPDTHPLAPMARPTKDVLAVAALDAVADKGYSWAPRVKAWGAAGISPYSPKFATLNSAKRGLFGKQHCRDDPGAACYWCPAGEPRHRRYPVTKHGLAALLDATKAGGAWALRPRCPRTGSRPRRLTRRAHEDPLDQMATRVKPRPDIMQRRRGIVEHPFGTIKRAMQQGEFLMKRRPKVRTEMSVTVLAYHLKRALNILGSRAIIDAVG